MDSLLATIVAFVGVILVLALAAQSVQEILKTVFVIRGRTMLRSLRGLIGEAVRAERQWPVDAETLFDEVVRRLEALGQNGFRAGKIRLDVLRAQDVADLVKAVECQKVPGLPVEEDEAQSVLDRIADRTSDWYTISMQPVDDRYRRRMRVLALASAAIVVLPLNVEAPRLFRAARTDATFRARVEEVVSHLDSTLTAVATERVAAPEEPAVGGAGADTSSPGTPASGPGGAAADTGIAAAAADTGSRQFPADTLDSGADAADSATVPGAVGPGAAADSTGGAGAQQADSTAAVATALRDLVEAGDVFGSPADWRPGDAGWWLGILLSILLVGLGAPFWHDVLESVFDLKGRIRAQTAVTKAAGATGPGTEAGGG
jgi:hypothetical protein